MCELAEDPFFNPNSPKQVKDVLWKRGLKVVDTRKATLMEYEGEEFIDAMRDFRDCDKMRSTYVDGLAECVYEDLRVHPDWRLPTETGRPRCSSPNLLGMPRKAEEAEHKWKRFIKEQFISDPGKVFMHLDRKQSEVRCMVFLADCIEFIKGLMADPKQDIHGAFTKMLYGAGYTKEQRVLVKMIVFGLIYNREAPSLAAQFTAIEREKARKIGSKEYKVWTTREAQKFIDEFFKLFPEMLVYKKIVTREALNSGVLRGYMGRLRRFGLINMDNRKSISNQAVNFMPSNMSADLNFLSCVETMKQFGKYGVDVLVPIHDAGLLSVPKDSLYLKDEITAMWEALPAKELSRPCLPVCEHNVNVPFPVDVSVGERWSEL
jgi:DNA polymerase-1